MKSKEKVTKQCGWAWAWAWAAKVAAAVVNAQLARVQDRTCRPHDTNVYVISTSQNALSHNTHTYHSFVYLHFGFLKIAKICNVQFQSRLTRARARRRLLGSASREKTGIPPVKPETSRSGNRNLFIRILCLWKMRLHVPKMVVKYCAHAQVAYLLWQVPW